MATDRAARRREETTQAVGDIGKAQRTHDGPARLPGTRCRAAAAQCERSLRRRLGHTRSRWNLAAIPATLRRGIERLRGAPRQVRLALPPIKTAAEIASTIEPITTALARGEITPLDAAALCEVADTQLRALAMREFDRRLKALEASADAAKS